MIEWKMTFNGQPVTADSLAKHVELALIQHVKDMVTEKLEDVPTELDGKHLVVEVRANALDQVEIFIEGPEELVQQAGALINGPG